MFVRSKKKNKPVDVERRANASWSRVKKRGERSNSVSYRNRYKERDGITMRKERERNALSKNVIR